ncbi:MAG: ATP-dependent Clp protease adapter ClpS [Oligoflexales bacterium]
MSKLSKPQEDHGLIVEEKAEVRPPPMYKVLLINDDYTPMEFVVDVLERIFGKDHATATELMLRVHHEGRAICGVYTLEIAETKVAQVSDESRKMGHPLQCTIEKE